MLKSTPYEDVLQIELCKYDEFVPGTSVCAYLVDGLLIDTGPSYTVKELTSFLEDKDLTIIVNTHHHEDHIAGNKILQDRFGVNILAHALAVDKIKQPAKLYPYQKEVWGYPVCSVATPLENEIRTKNHRFEVIHTPGHDRDHICLFDAKNGRLFSGDLFLGTRPSTSRPMEDNWQTVEDLKQIRELDANVIFSSSGLVLTNPNQRLEKVITALEDMGNRIQRLHEKGMTPHRIVEEIFGKESPKAELTQFQFSSENMVKCFLKGQE